MKENKIKCQQYSCKNTESNIILWDPIASPTAL